MDTVSSAELAERGGTTSAQVRKDLSFFGSFGKRGLGYSVPELAAKLRDILGLGSEYRVAIVGAGNIGQALVKFRGFGKRGFRVVSIYDRDPHKVDQEWNGVRVRDERFIEEDFASGPVDIAVIATPAGAAQQLADRLVAAGVRAILNFAPVQLQTPDRIVVKNVNLGLELEALSYGLRNS